MYCCWFVDLVSEFRENEMYKAVSEHPQELQTSLTLTILINSSWNGMWLVQQRKQNKL